MRFVHISLSMACAVLLSAQTLAAAGRTSVTLSGCLVKAADGDGYLITNAPAEPARTHPEDGRVSPNAFGGIGGFTTIMYWLDNEDRLKPHVGHRVEVEGDLKGDPTDGQLKVDRKDKWTELELKADGRMLKANVPNTSIEPGPDSKKDARSEVIVRRVSVEKVKMLGAGCMP